MEEVDLRDVTTRAVALMRDRFEANGFELELEMPPEAVTVRCDRDALVSVLVNLLDNAFKYSDERKNVAIRMRRLDGSARLEVADRGIGLSGRQARRIFERFFQVDQRLSRQATGCGLGLSIIRYIVEPHSGTIEVDSELGKGSRFTVSLPASVDGTLPAEEAGP